MVEHFRVKHRHRRADGCSNGLYIEPKMGASIDSLQPLPVSWDPSCLSSAQEIDIYLYAPTSATPRIHVWENIATTRAKYTAQLMPRWWNATSSQQLQLIIVPTGDPPFMSKFAAGPVFTATYTAPSSGPVPAAADTTQIDSGITLVNDVANANEKTSSGKKAAAGILVPLFLILLGVAVYIKLKRNREQAKRRAWTEKIDTRMSTISTDWKSVSAAGAQAAIRNSIAVGNRNSSFSFGAIRPLSSVDIDEKGAEKRPTSTMRTGTGVGLRNPNALSQVRTSERLSRVSFATDTQPRVSRVSFADQPRPSIESRRTNRPFHSAYVPPVPSIPRDREELSPEQTAGPLSLTPDDIKARIAAAANGKTKNGSVSGSEFDEVLPALSRTSHYLTIKIMTLIIIKTVMRTGDDPTHPDNLLLPTPPEPIYAKATTSPFHSTTTLSSITPTSSSPVSLFPMPPNQPSQTGTVLSPDEMLRAYAERKKSLAAAAAAGRIGAPIRVSTSASTLGLGSSASSLKSAGGMGMGNALTTTTTPVQTVGSIHDTGMRVAYRSDVARVSMKPSPSSRNSLASTTTTTASRKSTYTNPFVIPPPLPTSPTDDDYVDQNLTGQHKKTKSQAHAEAYTRAERAISLAKQVDDELAEAEAEADAHANAMMDVVGMHPYAFTDPSDVTHPYAYAYGGQVGEVADADADAGDVGMAGRGAFGYYHQRI